MSALFLVNHLYTYFSKNNFVNLFEVFLKVFVNIDFLIKLFISVLYHFNLYINYFIAVISTILLMTMILTSLYHSSLSVHIFLTVCLSFRTIFAAPLRDCGHIGAAAP